MLSLFVCLAVRKANCDGYGALCYDPRFVGGDGVMFYFHGAKGGNFAIVSDDEFQINAHFIGTRPQGRTRDYTWVQALAVMFDTHTLVIPMRHSIGCNGKSVCVKHDRECLHPCVVSSPSFWSSTNEVSIDLELII